MPYHIWASKAANAVLIVSILAPFSPVIVFYALALLGSMYVFEVFALVRLHAKPPKRGVEGASVFVTMLFGCCIATVVSTAYQTFLFFGGGSPNSVSSDADEANPSLAEGRFAASMLCTIIFLAVVYAASYVPARLIFAAPHAAHARVRLRNPTAHHLTSALNRPNNDRYVLNILAACTFCRGLRLDLCTCGKVTDATVAAQASLRALRADDSEAYIAAAAGVAESVRTNN